MLYLNRIVMDKFTSINRFIMEENNGNKSYAPCVHSN